MENGSTDLCVPRLQILSYYGIGAPLSVALAMPWGADLGLAGIWWGIALGRLGGAVGVLFIGRQSNMGAILTAARRRLGPVDDPLVDVVNDKY